MSKLQIYLIVFGVVGAFYLGSLLISFNKGRSYERGIWERKQTESSLQDVDVEKKQNEVRNRPITDPELDGLLRSGGFGQL